MRQCILTLSLCLLAQPCLAAWNWYAGDLVSYTLYPPDQLSNHFQEAIDEQLDYRIFYTSHTESPFSGLANFLSEADFNDPDRFTPILGATSRDTSQTVIYLGVDPRSPIPTNNAALNQWAISQGGVSVTKHLPTTSHTPHLLSDRPLLFQALSTEGWHPAVEIGSKWDSLLTGRHRIGIVGHASQITSVWAESTHPDHLFAGFNNLATIVTDHKGLLAGFRVNGEVPGTMILPESSINIRLTATASEPIRYIHLIADGKIIWSSSPNTTTVSTRVQLPISDEKYIRAEFLTESHRTLTSPIYFASEFYSEPFNDLSFEEVPQYLMLDGVLESLTILPTEAQARVLAEYISHTQTQFAMALVLENRTDMISDTLLETLSMSPFPQVRLGAAFVRVLRNAPTLPTHLEHLLSDPDPTIQTYAARMLLQYTPPQYWPPLYEQMDVVAPNAQAYLIQTLDPNSSDEMLHRNLIHNTRDPNPRVASAASAKLVEMGNLSYRVIRTLQDSARAGHMTSLNILGIIGDERIAPDIEKMYLNASPSRFKNTAFQILQSFFPNSDHYPNRPQIHDNGAIPQIDTLFVADEWQGAATIDRFVDDAHTGPVYDDLDVYITRNKAGLVFGFSLPVSKTDLPHHLELSLATTLAPEIPFVFTIPFAATDEIPSDPTLHIERHQTTSHWTAEGTVAFSELGLDPAISVPYLRFNVSLVTQTKRWSWTPTYGMPNNPQRFGMLHLHTPH